MERVARKTHLPEYIKETYMSMYYALGALGCADWILVVVQAVVEGRQRPNVNYAELAAILGYVSDKLTNLCKYSDYE